LAFAQEWNMGKNKRPSRKINKEKMKEVVAGCAGQTS
jgi:hypothetical protein